MKCIDNMERITLSADIVLKMMNLYQFKGKEFYYYDVVDSDIDYIIKQTVERETFYCYKFLNLDISESKVKLIIKKDGKCKTKDEVLLKNIKQMFFLIQDKKVDFELNANSILDLAKYIYRDVQNVGFASYQTIEQNNLLREKKTIYKRVDLENLLHLYSKKIESKEYETSLLITNFFIDFINMKCFKIENEMFLAYVCFYLLLFKEGFDLFKYVSFFEIMYHAKEQLQNCILQANFNWQEGFSQTGPLHRLLVSELLKAYNEVEKMIRDYEYDNKLNKSNNIENSILKLGETFTKDELRAKHPYVSESTINRTLQRLRDEEKIRPLGTGRSAKWIRIVDQPKKFSAFEQLDIFSEDDI